VRFVAWKATHDIGHQGVSLDNKIKLVDELSKHLRVFISSEETLSPELKKFGIRINPETIHDALAYANLYIGESATMASECAMLGTPAIFLDNVGRGYTDNEEKEYGLVFNFTESIEDQNRAITKAIELAKLENIKEEYVMKRDKMLEDKIDVTAFLVWFVENFPESKKVMQSHGFSFEVFK